jgi:hypothetical protein
MSKKYIGGTIGLLFVVLCIWVFFVQKNQNTLDSVEYLLHEADVKNEINTVVSESKTNTVYTSTEFGFAIPVPEVWENTYKTKITYGSEMEGDVATARIEFWLPTTDEGWRNARAGMEGDIPGYVPVYGISLYPLDAFRKIVAECENGVKNDDISAGCNEVFGKTAEYGFVLGHAQDGPSDMVQYNNDGFTSEFLKKNFKAL